MRKRFEIPKGSWPLNLKGYASFFERIGYVHVEKDADFLVLPGGIDVGLLKERDEVEIERLQEYLSTDKPIVAICRGFQLSVIADGGSIIPDIPEGRWFYKHTTLTGHWTGQSSWHLTSLGLLTNSRHHQGFREIPKDWVILDKTNDGVIEAATKGRILGVQWHPEHPEMKGTSAEDWYIETLTNHLKD